MTAPTCLRCGRGLASTSALLCDACAHDPELARVLTADTVPAPPEPEPTRTEPEEER